MQFERIAEQAVFPSCASASHDTHQTTPAAPNLNPTLNPSLPPDRKRLCSPSPVAHAELAALPGLVDALVHDLRAFTRRIDIFNIIFAEVRVPLCLFCLRCRLY